MKLCLICGQHAETHHLYKRQWRNANACDEEWNCMPLTRKYHTEAHTIGLRAFADKYHRVRAWLIKNGWILNNYTGKWENEKFYKWRQENKTV